MSKNGIYLQELIVEMAGLIREHYADGKTSIYNNAFVDNSWNIKLNSLVDNIIKKYNMKVSGWSKSDLQKIIGQIVFKYKFHELNKEDIESFFEREINLPDEQFSVIRPVYGVSIKNADTIELGPFVIFTKDLARRWLDQKLEQFSEQVQYNHIDDVVSIDAEYFIKIEVRSKTGRRAVEIADDRFDAFESVIKFMQIENQNYNVCVLNDESVAVKKVVAISSNGYHSNSSLKGLYRMMELDENEIKKDNFPIIWEMMEEYNNGNINEWKKRILLAIICVGHAAREYNEVNKFLQYIFAMEIIMHNNADGLISPSIANQIAETSAFIISDDIDSRKDIYKKAKEVYSKRSAAVHGGSNNISEDLIIKARSIVYCLIHSILRSEELMRLSNAKDLYEWTMNRRFK